MVALEQAKNSVAYYHIGTALKKRSKVALIVGNEVNGIPASILKKADMIAQIPMLGEKESLNVATATGIMLYHLRFS